MLPPRALGSGNVQQIDPSRSLDFRHHADLLFRAGDSSHHTAADQVRHVISSLRKRSPVLVGYKKVPAPKGFCLVDRIDTR